MAVQWLLVCHGLVTLLVVVSFLCGQWPIFQGTFIERINFFLTFGACDHFRRIVRRVFGSRGIDAVLSVEYYCCDRPNPILQVIYLAIVGGTYYIVVKSSFSYIPGYYLSEVHRYTSLLAVGVGIILFLLTSFSDPGTVNAENVSQYLSAYPYDNIIFSEKECSTCKILKPARSKHCSICDRCVARFDHHCGWMNNCIGERNTRFFMAFLLWHLVSGYIFHMLVVEIPYVWLKLQSLVLLMIKRFCRHFLLCVYGTVALGLVLAGQVKEFKVIYILTVYYGIENSFHTLAPHVVQWLLGSYNTQILLMVFMAIVSLLLAGFFGYHASLCLTNTTTNETFKWADYLRWHKKVQEAKRSSEELKASISGLNNERIPPESKWKPLCGRSRLEEKEIVKVNAYNKGWLHNLNEIAFPLSARSPFSQAKSKSG